MHVVPQLTNLDYMQKTCKIRLVYKNQIRAKQENNDAYGQLWKSERRNTERNAERK